MINKIKNWLLANNRFEKYKDTFAVDQATKFTALCGTVNRRLLLDNVVIVITHFPTTFLKVQDCFEAQSIAYQIAKSVVTPEDILQHAKSYPQQVMLMLGESVLQPTSVQDVKSTNKSIKVATIVTERHPLPKRDESIEDFFRQLPFVSRVGYFLALDDASVKAAVNDTLLQLFKQLGLDNHELISSVMVTRRMNIVLGRLASKVKNEIRADSPEEWFERNLKTIGPTSKKG